MFFIFFILFFTASFAIGSPIIGILSQETHIVRKLFPENHYDSYIAASYVKFLESAGARVLPVWIGQNEEYYERVLNYTNGILLPGGATYFDEPDGYGDAISKIYKIAENLNKENNYFPLLGICLGMEALAFASNNNTDLRVSCESVRVSRPLIFEPDFQSSRMFKGIPTEILTILEKKEVTYNSHRYCLTKEQLKMKNLTDTWRVISNNKDEKGEEFISTMEHFEFPFYGLQFHPEKNRFEFRSSLNIPHNLYGDIASQYFAEFFIEECRKNTNKFPDENLELDSLIYNFNPKFTARDSEFYQLYMFTKDDFKKYQLN